MRKFLIFLALFFAFGLPVLAEIPPDMELPSETGVVKSIQYEDSHELQQGNNNIKQIVEVKVISGKFKGTERFIENMLTGNPAYDINLKKGDKVVLHAETEQSEITSAEDVNFFIADIKRDNTLIFITSAFLILLVLIGRKKGLASLISIAATILLIFLILLPGILHGFCPILLALIVSVLSTIITIYLVGGFNAKSTSAILGTVISLVVAAFLGMGVIYFAHLTGFAGEENLFLYSAHPQLNFKGLLAASMIIAALGALMDTAVSVASTINEIHETDTTLSVKQLFVSGMNVGKDIIGTMSNTLILVYLGSSLPLVLLSGNIDVQKFFNLNQVATEITSAIVGSIAILACVPVTAFIASYMVKKQKQKIEFNLNNLENE